MWGEVRRELSDLPGYKLRVSTTQACSNSKGKSRSSRNRNGNRNGDSSTVCVPGLLRVGGRMHRCMHGWTARTSRTHEFTETCGAKEWKPLPPSPKP